jgi:hypothetical protein
VNTAEIFAEAVKLRDAENLLDVGIAVTRGRYTDILWLSRGTMKRQLKKLLRRGGIAEAFFLVRNNGDGRWIASAQALPGIDPKRAQVLIWNFGRKHHRWQERLH